MVRWTLCLIAVALLSTVSAAQDKPEDIVKKAIIKTGGEAVLKQFPAGQSKMKGKMILGGMDLPFTGSMVFAVPGKIRMELTVVIGGRDVKLEQVVNGTGVKQTEDGKQVENISEAAKTELLQGALLQEIALLYPLLDPKKYVLKAGAGTADAVAVVVDSPDTKLKTVTLFFDKKSGLLVKMTRKGLSPTGAPVDEETAYSDYKDQGGIKVPMSSKVSHNGTPFLDIIVTEYKPLEKTDEKFNTGS